ncbi:MAG TPA: sugar ABC transporter substrate-binding protein [Polaromonas sp.]|uniref:sugar ABC transporter substrate-binding protein n=1 Tax=Polaromonas sp. TaxID=1869339 RepID=UPI002D630C95|nr:sugar ABC transporter substrate-binding protein [Polaromonas sp.]HYW56241.1 sugar ABC transporter substrate-binding protein [Polaromonas sp.]
MNTFPRRKVVALATAVLLAAYAPMGIAQTKPKVGLVMKSLANEFFKNMTEGAIAHEKKRGDFELKPVGMQSETDFDAQTAAVENFVTQKFDVIVVAPADSRAMVAPIAKALKAGITVVNFDVALDQAAMKKAGLDLAFVGPDNRAGARLAGDELARVLGAGAKVVIIEGNPGADNALQRKLGFEDAAKAGKLNVIASQTANWETEQANALFTNMLTANPDIKGVMAANDSMALGVAKAIDAAGKSGQIKVVGFDNIPAIRPLIRQGKVLATVDQFGSEMAANAIDYGLKARKDKKPLKGWIKTPIELVTSKNVKG